MKRFTGLVALALLAGCAETATEPDAAVLPTSQAVVAGGPAGVTCGLAGKAVRSLGECVTLDAVRAHQAAFQAIADANGGIRASGTPGYDASVDYVAGLLADAGYDVTIQPFTYNAFIRLGVSTLAQVSPVAVSYVQDVDFRAMSQSEPGSVTAAVTPVDLQMGPGNTSTSGCEAADFAGFPAGNIALIQRGVCEFRVKAENAAAAGAVAVVLFNQGNIPDREGLISGTLGTSYSGGIPVMEATYALGVEWALQPGLVASLHANVFRGTASTANVLAETPGGDPSNVVMAGGHLDSVDRGPGINDNGSGSAALLEVALQLAGTKTRNKVRFAWWGAEESGLIGSDHYVFGLTDEERNAIALYLNFDMIASPNAGYFIYDGDGSSFGLSGPTGSDAIEAFFQDFYAGRGLAQEAAQISGRSDYAAFFGWGIPFGGVFTGAEGIKTAAQAAQWGGVAGAQFDPCYHLACDTFANVNLQALDVNSDAVAEAVMQYAMSTEAVNGAKGKGNYRPKNPAAPRGPETSELTVR